MGFSTADHHVRVRMGGHQDFGYGACHISELKAGLLLLRPPSSSSPKLVCFPPVPSLIYTPSHTVLGTAGWMDGQQIEMHQRPE